MAELVPDDAPVHVPQSRNTPWLAKEKPPEPRSMRKVVLAVVAGLLLLGGAAGALAWRAIGRPTQWREHLSVAGGFRTELPGPPRADIAAVIGGDGPNAPIEGATFRNRYYAVIWEDLWGRNDWETDDMVLDRGLANLSDVLPPGSVAAGARGALGPFGTREALIEVPSERVAVKLVAAESRVYVLAVGGRTVSPDDIDVRRFFDSFAVTDGTFAVKAEKRAERERQRAEGERQRLAAEAKHKAEVEALREKWRREAEQKKRQEAHAVVVNQRNAEFLNADPYAGPTPPAVGTLAGPLQYTRAIAPGKGEQETVYDTFGYSLERAEVHPGERELVPVVLRPDAHLGQKASVQKASVGLTNVVPGPGVRGGAAYLTGAAQSFPFGGDDTDSIGPARALSLTTGYTLAAWVRVKHGPLVVAAVVRRDGVADSAKCPAELTVGRSAIRASVLTPDGQKAVEHPWTRDEKWHHVALVRDANPAAPALKLYFDGAEVGSVAAPVLVLPDVAALKFGARGTDPAWPGPTDAEGAVAPPGETEVVAGLDECAVFGRPLTAEEVRTLVGRPSQTRPTDIAVKFVPQRGLGRVALAAFDPLRKCVWVAHDAPPGKPAALRKLSYPGFEEQAKYQLNGSVTAGALDVPRNRLYLAVADTPPPGPDNYAGPFPGTGRLHRYDLSDLPGALTGLIEPSEVCPARFNVRAVLVAPDGATVVFAAASPTGRRAAAAIWEGGTLYRTAPGLGTVERLPANWQLVAAHHLKWAEPGRTARVELIRDLNGNCSEGVDIDVNTWAARSVPGGGSNPTYANVLVHRAPVAGGAFDLVTLTDPTVWPGADPNPPVELVAAGGAPSPFKPQQFAPKGPRVSKVLSAVRAEGSERLEGPLWVAPDGRALVLRSGHVFRLESEIDLTPDPAGLKALVAVPPPKVPVAPHPHERPNVGPVPAASEFKGLVLYLDFETRAAGDLLDAVTGKHVGRIASDVLRVGGPRGRAVRVFPDVMGRKNDFLPVALDLDRERFEIPRDGPFALSYWVRVAEPLGPRFGTAFTAPIREKGTEFALSAQLRGEQVVFNVYALPGPVRLKADAKHAAERWAHHAVTRDAAGHVRFYANGTCLNLNRADPAVPQSWTPQYVRFGQFGLECQSIEFDEIALFDRALTDAEVRRLAGRGAK